VYRGSTGEPLDLSRGKNNGISFSLGKEPASRFGPVQEHAIDKNAKILNFEDIPKELIKKDPVLGLTTHDKNAESIVKYARDNGYDVVDLRKFGEGEYRVLNPNVVKSSVAQQTLSDAQLKGMMYKNVPLSNVPNAETSTLSTEGKKLLEHQASQQAGQKPVSTGYPEQAQQGGASFPPSDPTIPQEVQNPQDPFYNVNRVGVSAEKQQQLKQTFEDVTPEVQGIVGDKPLTHQEIIAEASRTNKTFNKTMTREQTKEIGAAMYNLRNQVAKMAETGTVTPEFIDALLKDKAIAQSQAQLLGQRAINSSPDKAAMQQIIEEILKRNQNTDEILRAAEGVDFNDANQAAAFYRQFVKPKLGDYIDLIRYNSMLSSPLTHIVNASSNLLNSSVVAPVEKTLTGSIDFLNPVRRIQGKPQTQFASEGAAYTAGYWSKIGDASHRFADVLRGKQSSANLDLQRISPLHGQKGEVLLSLPTRLLEASDQFFTALTEGGETAALNLRQAKGVNVGSIPLKASQNAAYRLFRSELHDKRQGVLLDAVDDLTGKIQALRSSENRVTSTIAKFTLPFVRTPMNIFKQMMEYSPGGVATMIGAKNPTEQLSKAILGTAGISAAMTLVTSGRTTWAEPSDPKKRAAFRAAGLQPYALKIGGNWVSYAKLPPAMSVPLATIAALYDAEQNKTLDQSQIDAVLTGIANTGNFFSDQSYLKNIGDAIAATKGSPENVAQFVGNYPQQLVPYRAFLGWIARIVDPYQRKVNTDAGVLTQQVQQLLTQIPIASGNVPARVDQFENPIANQNKEINAISPFKITTERPEAKQTYDLMQQKSLNTKNINAAKDMILRGETPDFSAIGQSQAAEVAKAPSINQVEAAGTDAQQQLKTKALEEVARQKAQLTGEISVINNKIIYGENGSAKSIDLNAPTKGQGIDVFSNQDWQYAKARDVWKANIPQANKDNAFKKLGVDPEDVRYDYLANHNADQSTQYIVSKNLPHDELLNRLITGRVVSISGEQFAKNGVLDQLKEKGLLTDAETKQLKALKLDKNGKSLVAPKGTGKGKKGTVTIKRVAPARVHVSQPQRRKLPTVKIQHGTKTVSIKTVGASNKVKLSTPQQGFSYKIVRPKLTGLQQGVKIV
jgi:hypothetical protein